MKPTLDDLRAALHDEADAAAFPNVDALVAGAGRRVGAARRRRRVALGAATVAVLVVGGLVATRPADKVVPRPAGPGPFTVNVGGAGFPEFTVGMKRVMVLDAPMPERAKGSVLVPTTPGQELAVAMTCSPFTDADQSGWISLMTAKITGPGGRYGRACDMPISMLRPETIGVAAAATTTVSADVLAAPPAMVVTPKSAKVHFAIYLSVPFQSYPFPTRPDGENAPTWGSNYPSGTSGPYGPSTVADANKALSMSFPYNPKWNVGLEVRGPGRLRVLIDGINVSGSIGGSRMPVRDGYLTKWDYDSVGASFPLDPTMAPWPPAGSWTSGPPIKPGTQVSLVIIPADFTGPDWRVTYGPNPN
jgi:hypothetical protein